MTLQVGIVELAVQQIVQLVSASLSSEFRLWFDCVSRQTRAAVTRPRPGTRWRSLAF